LLRQE